MKADLIVFNGHIYTADRKNSIAEALAVKDGLITAVGSNVEILNTVKTEQIVDAGGKAIFPGFIDPHCHFFWYAYSKAQADLREASSMEEVTKILKAHYENSNTLWIQGFGWDENNWTEKKKPDKSILDRAFPDSPVLLTRIDTHAALVNQKALDLANITIDTSVKGGKIEKSEEGLTGILVDSAIDLVKEKIDLVSRKDQLHLLYQAARDCFAVGLTTVSDALMDTPEIELAREITKKDDWFLRLYGMIRPTKSNKEFFFSNGPLLEPKLHLGAFKFFADGALGSRGACLFEPYNDDPENSGMYVLDEANFKDTANKALSRNFQINTHCIGDAAVRKVLHLYGLCLKKTNKHRWRIEHAQMIDPDDLPLFRHFDIVPSVQAVQAVSDISWITKRIGKKRIPRAYPLKQLVDYCGKVANGSDFPVEKISPIQGFYAAITLKGRNNEVISEWENHKLTRKEALKAMTIWAALANKEEDRKGSIEIGKFADFVILEKDLMKIPEDQIPRTGVWATFIGGECVFKKSVKSG